MATAGTARTGMMGTGEASGATAALTVGRGAVSESQLLDVLYEILAQGGDAQGELTAGDIEAFLHEHARAPKSTAEMLAFFERFELSTDPQMYGADPELGEMASGLHRERGPSSSVFSLDDAMADVGATEEPITGSHAIARSATKPEPSFAPMTVMTLPPSPATAPLWLRASVGVLAMCLVGAAAFSYTRAQDLEERLGQARLQQRSTDAALTALEQRAAQLQGALRESESGRRSLDFTLQAYIAEQATQRNAEQAALQKLLGPRYQTLTLQNLTTAP